MFDSPYINNKNFEFNESQLMLSSDFGFNEYYERAMCGDSSVYALCIDALNNIFRELSVANSDPKMQSFLSELHAESARVLNEDLEVKYPNNSANCLGADKYFVVDIEQLDADKILKITAPLWEQFRKNANKGRLTREDLSINCGQVASQVVKLLNKAFKKKGIIKMVSSYMGRAYEVVGVAVELSVDQANWWHFNYSDQSMPETLYYHTDESRKFPKAIVYLNDVNESNGPTSCVPGLLDTMQVTNLQFLVGRVIGNVGRREDSDLASNYQHIYHQIFGCSNFRKDFCKLPKEMQFSSHFGTDIQKGSELEKHIVDNEVVVKGGKGTALVFDGAALVHRGGLVLKGERQALQVVFGPRHSISKRVLNKSRSIFKALFK